MTDVRPGGPRRSPRNAKLYDSRERKVVAAPCGPLPEAPWYVQDDAAALAVWQRIVPEAHASGLVTMLDSDTLAAYCATVVIHQRAMAALLADGPVVDGYRGSPVKHPAAQVARDSGRDLLALGNALGLTPAGRRGRELPEPEEELSPEEQAELDGKLALLS